VIAAVVLAAGGSTRFGSPKQLAELDGRPLLDHALDSVRDAPGIDRIIVVVGAAADEIRDGVDLAGAEVVEAPNWEEGISASLRAGVRAAADADHAVIVLGDQPLLSPAAITRTLAGAGEGCSRATYGGRPGHPVVIAAPLFAEVSRLRGDDGARDLLAAHGIAEVECGDLGDAPDVDTPSDLEALARNRTNLEVSG
jgi:molybdenum cofactor cytidylyltransferase